MISKKVVKKLYLSAKNSLLKHASKLVVLVSVITIVAVSGNLVMDNTIKPTTPKEASKVTVAIVRRDFRSGGSGVILSSSSKESKILTNRHVCSVVVNGGVVVTATGAQYAVTGYKKSQIHDICLITVAADLRYSTELASRAPEEFSPAAVSGHPSLLPTVVTNGHFSGKMVIDVLEEVVPCSEDDIKNNPLLCMFFGGIPKANSYESQLVTATIQPGSSGSAVYNENGEISGLVFAGSGDLGYALIVPYEYVADFVFHEEKTLVLKKPNMGVSLGSQESEQIKSKNKKKVKSYKEIVNSCFQSKFKENSNISKICKLFNYNMIFD